MVKHIRTILIVMDFSNDSAHILVQWFSKGGSLVYVIRFAVTKKNIIKNTVVIHQNEKLQ